MSTGTDVILCVILAMIKVAWCRLYPNLSGRKTPPRWVTTNTTSKKGLKGRLVVGVTALGLGFHHVMHKIIAD